MLFRSKTLPVWQGDVRGYDVFDSTSGKYLSSFYLDHSAVQARASGLLLGYACVPPAGIRQGVSVLADLLRKPALRRAPK